MRHTPALPIRSVAALLCLINLSVWASGCASSPTVPRPASAASGTFAFWPSFPDDPRIQFVRSIASSEDLAPPKENALEKIIFGKHVGDSEFISKPYGAAMRDGKLYVCDLRGACLTVLDLQKKQTRLVGVSGSMPLKRPVAVAAADDGELYVADSERGTILVYDSQERYSRAIGHPKLKPAGLAVYQDRLYVTDMASQLVDVYDRRTGNQTGTIGSVGDEDGQFRLPLGIAVDTKGDVYVADMMRCRVQKFSPDGKFISGFGSLGDFAGAFVRPKHIAVDSDGIVYVVDAAFQNVQMFDDKYHLLMHFGSAGDFPGSMNLPAGICVTDDSLDLMQGLIHPGFKAKRLVIVTNQFSNSKVSLYAMGGLREGHSAKELAASALKVPSGMGEGAKNLLQAPVPGSEEGPSKSADPSAAPGATGTASPSPNPPPTPTPSVAPMPSKPQ